MLDIGIYGELRFFVYSFYLLFVFVMNILTDGRTRSQAYSKLPCVQNWEGVRRLLIFIALSDSFHASSV